MKIKYRILKSHCGDPSTIHSEPSFEGSSKEECDKKAIAHFEKIQKDPDHLWCSFLLYRIDVEEVTTHVNTGK